MFKILTYNTGSITNINKLLEYRGQPKIKIPDELNKTNRLHLLFDELDEIDADILCLQEIVQIEFIKKIQPYMKKSYDGIFIPRVPGHYGTSKSYIKPSDLYSDGLAIFFKYKRFNIIQFSSIDYPYLYKSFFGNAMTPVIENKVYRLFGGLYLYLEDKESRKRFHLVNFHLVSNPYLDDVKHLQMFLIMRFLDTKISDRMEGVILAGDTNSTPESSTYKAITSGISSIDFDFESQRTGKHPLLPILLLPTTEYTKQKFTSVYKNFYKSEPKFTNFNISTKFIGTLDYIFVNQNITIVFTEKTINKPGKDWEKKRPSDHIPIVSIVRLREEATVGVCQYE